MATVTDPDVDAMTNARKQTCAVYIRCSTDKQSLENQRPDLLRLADARGWEVGHVFEEKISALKSRPQYNAMMRAAHEGRFKVLVIWSLDRLGRSMVGNVEALLKLDRAGVTVVSVREPWLDTGGPIRDLLVSIFSWIAQQERQRISERTMAGLDRARRKGRQLGRPKKWINIEQALALRASGMSIRQVARKLGVGSSTLHRAIQEHAGRATGMDCVPESGTPEAA